MPSEASEDEGSVNSATSQPADEEQPPAKRQRGENAHQDALHRLKELGIMRKNDGDGHASFVGSASGIHFIKSVYHAIGGNRRGSLADVETPDSMVPGEDDRLTQGAVNEAPKYLWRPNEVTMAHGQEPVAVSFEDMISWSALYWDNWHPFYPFLHAPSVLEFFESFETTPAAIHEQQQPLRMAILRSIMSISIADRRQAGVVIERAVPSWLVFDTFLGAVESVNKAISEPTSMLALQAVVCVQLFLISMLRHNAASRLGGCIIRMCHHLGLHRCPSRYPTFSEDERSLRRRLFWSVYCIDRYITHSLGFPLGIRDDDVDVCLPSSEIHGLNAEGPKAPIDDRLKFLDLLVKQGQIKGMIMESRNKTVSYRTSGTEQTETINFQLSKWFNEVESMVDEDSESQKIGPFQRTLLLVLKHECTIALNRPLLAMSKKTSTYRLALQTCISSSRKVITLLHDILKEQTVTNGPRTPLFWPSFTWCVWMSAFLLLYAAAEEEIPQHTTLKLVDHSVEILKHLASRGSIWPQACQAAIHELRQKLLRPKDQKPEGGQTRGNRGRGTQPRRTNTGHGSKANSELMRENEADNGSKTAHVSVPTATTSTNTSRQVRRSTIHNPVRPSRAQRPPTSSPQAPTSQNDGYGSGSTNQFHFHRHQLTSSPTPSDHFATPYDMSNQYQFPMQNPNWRSDSPETDPGGVDMFSAYEIPFWIGDEQYNALMRG